MYQIIADAEINRDLAKTEKLMSAKKAEVIKVMEFTAARVDTPEEKRLVAEVKGALDELLNLYETKLLPLIKSGDGIGAEIREVDAKIDHLASKMESGMDQLLASMEKGARAGVRPGGNGHCTVVDDSTARAPGVARR